MAELPKNKMEEKSPRFGFKTANVVAIFNDAASLSLHISDVYLSVVCHLGEQIEKPTLITFFEDQAEVKRYQAKRFLDYIKRRKGTISLQDHKSPDVKNWGNLIDIMKVLLDMESTTTMLIQSLKIQASEAKDSHLGRILRDILIKQKRNEDFLEYQIDYETKSLEMQEEGNMHEEPTTTSDQAT